MCYKNGHCAGAVRGNGHAQLGGGRGGKGRKPALDEDGLQELAGVPHIVLNEALGNVVRLTGKGARDAEHGFLHGGGRNGGG